MSGVTSEIYVSIGSAITARNRDVGSICRSNEDLIDLDWIWTVYPTESSIDCVLRGDIIRLLPYWQQQVGSKYVLFVLSNACRA